MTLRATWIVFLLFVWAVLVPAQAQITIVASDVESALSRGFYGKQTLTASSGETATIQAVIDQVGAGGTYDFSTVAVSASFSENELQSTPFGSSVPTDPAFDDADFVDISSVFGTSKTYSFLGIESDPGGDPDGVYDFGDASPGSFFSTKTTNEPGLRVLPLPITNGTSWSSAAVTRKTFINGTLDEEVQVTYSGEVIGYGSLVLPGGTMVPALVHRFVQVEDGQTTRSLSFITKGQVGSATILIDDQGDVVEVPSGTGSTVPAAFFNLESQSAASEEFTAGETGSFLGGSLGALVEITSASTTGSALRGYRVDFGSFQNLIDDSGTPAGFPVVNVAADTYWVLEVGAFNGTYTICLDYAGISGISNENELAVMKRGTSGEPWVTLGSSVNTGTNQVCASGQTTFSEFTIGGGSSNPLPVELTRFDAVQGADGVILTWETASESRNAGFQIERADADGVFRRLGFRDGAGTTTQAQSYRFQDTTLPFTDDALRYRLRQVDLDGTASFSEEVIVRRTVPERVRLHAPFPNPVRAGATIRYTLSEPTDVDIGIYNVLGQRVAVVAQGWQEAGRREQRVDAGPLQSGLYFVRLQAGGTVETRRLTVLR